MKLLSLTLRQYIEKNLSSGFILLGFVLLLFFNIQFTKGEQQFVFLAKSFLEGKLYFTQMPAGSFSDASLFNGKYFWPQGPFPAVILMPFVALFGTLFSQGIIQFFLNILNFVLLFRIAKKITSNTNTSLWLSLAYIFSSSYLLVGLIPWSWWYAQIVATSMLLLALYLYFNKKPLLLVGFFLTCAIATRISLIFAVIFFIYLIFKTDKERLRNLVQLLIPILGGLFFLGLYNYFRFNNFLEFGYKYHLPTINILANNLKIATWSFRYYPTNLYYLFVKSPEPVFISGTSILKFPFLKPDIWGMSIFLISPWLLWIIKAPLKNKIVQASLLSTILIWLFLMGYFSTGVRQLGFRYSLDFIPFLFVLLNYALKKSLSRTIKLLIILGFFVNLFFFPQVLVSQLN